MKSIAVVVALWGFADALQVTQRLLGRTKRQPLEVLNDPRVNYRQVRKAETSWRRKWQDKQTPKPAEVEAVFRALGVIKDSDRIGALLRAVDRCEFRADTSRMFAAAMCALSISGAKDEAKQLLDRQPEDADFLALAMAGDDDDDLMMELRHDTVAQRALIAMQRFGFLDLHGLNWDQAHLALRVVLRAPEITHSDSLKVVTGRGRHCAPGKVTLRDHVLELFNGDPMLQELPDNAGAFRLVLYPDEEEEQEE